jgi:hypothetical protein
MLSVLHGGFRARNLVVPTPTPDLPRSPSASSPTKLNRSQWAFEYAKHHQDTTAAINHQSAEIGRISGCRSVNITPSSHDGRKIVVEKNDIGGVLGNLSSAPICETNIRSLQSRCIISPSPVMPQLVGPGKS